MFIRRENFRQYIKFYPIVSILIAVNIFIYLLKLLPIIGDIIYYGGMHVNGLIADGQWWRGVTSIFLHGSFWHLFLNMFSLFLFGPELEQIAGKIRFITIYILSGLFGNVATFIFESANYGSVGSSGAIYGLFGAYLAIIYYTRNTIPQLRQIILPIIVIGLIMTFIQPNINVSAHIGGLITGFLLGLTYFSPKNILRWRIK